MSAVHNFEHEMSKLLECSPDMVEVDTKHVLAALYKKNVNNIR